MAPAPIKLHEQPAPAVELPRGYRLVANRIKCARVSHRLDCGCTIKPGHHYHQVAFGVGRQIVYLKRHIFGCLEDIQPRRTLLPKSVLN